MNLQCQRAFLLAYGLVPEQVDVIEHPGVELVECPHFGDQVVDLTLVKLLTYVDHDFMFTFGLCPKCGHGYYMAPTWDWTRWRMMKGLPA